MEGIGLEKLITDKLSLTPDELILISRPAPCNARFVWRCACPLACDSCERGWERFAMTSKCWQEDG